MISLGGRWVGGHSGSRVIQGQQPVLPVAKIAEEMLKLSVALLSTYT